MWLRTDHSGPLLLCTFPCLFGDSGDSEFTYVCSFSYSLVNSDHSFQEVLFLNYDSSYSPVSGYQPTRVALPLCLYFAIITPGTHSSSRPTNW